MRIKKKKNLDKRLKEVENYLIKPSKNILNVKEAVLVKDYFDLEEIFGNSNELSLDIGCGKGSFAVNFGETFSSENIVGVEKMQNIILSGCELLKERDLQNVKFLNSGAEYLPRYFKENSIKNIFLNFSPPFPQKSYENRRLTNPEFLKVYKYLLKKEGKLYLKTDDADFFDYSVEMLGKNGFAVKIENAEQLNVPKTEYERKFLALGMKIYALSAKLNADL